MRFLNPKTDFAFKKIFGSRQSKDILISFLNALLYDGQTTILDLEILDPYQAPQLVGMKDSFLDVKATITGNKTVIVEMQVLNVLAFEKRVLYNAAKAFCIQLDVGQGYSRLNPVIALTITDFELFANMDKVISHYQLREKENSRLYTDDLELVFVELPKFQKQLDELETLTDQWIFFLKTAQMLEAVPDTFSDSPALSKAFEIAELSRLNRKELELVERKELFLEDSRNAIAKALQDGQQAGRQQGLEEGREEGRQQGQEEGREEGRQQGEREKAIAIARSLLDLLPVDTISERTGLTLEDVRQLQQDGGGGSGDGDA